MICHQLGYGVLKGKYQYWSFVGSFGDPINGGIGVGAETPDEDAVMAYGVWAFGSILESTIPTRGQIQCVQQISATISGIWPVYLNYLNYFGAAFLYGGRKASLPEWLDPSRSSRGMISALWEIRQTCGASYTDKSMAISLARLRDSLPTMSLTNPPSSDQTNALVRMAFSMAENLIEENIADSRPAKADAIFEKYGVIK